MVVDLYLTASIVDLYLTASILVEGNCLNA